MSLSIVIVPAPERSEHWEALQAFLRPAAEIGGLGCLLDENELLWAVLDGNRPVAAATIRLTVDDVMEIPLVGGVGAARWLKALDEAIGACAIEAGARRLRAAGRRGWHRMLTRQGWDSLGERDGFYVYERELRG